MVKRPGNSDNGEAEVNTLNMELLSNAMYRRIFLRIYCDNNGIYWRK